MSITGMTCSMPGERSRLISAVREYRGPEGEPKGFQLPACPPDLNPQKHIWLPVKRDIGDLAG
ncbi:hypothetical protein JCM12681A_72490 [Streptomyces mexicanus]